MTLTDRSLDHANGHGRQAVPALSPPTFRQPPTAAAPDTYLIHEVQHALGAPLSVYINSAVIQAEQPILVDTGSARNRQGWVEDAFSLVEPQDVRWVFVSHEDHDHTGNLAQVMQMCPNATLVASWAMTERFTNAFEFPLARCRWLNDGDSFEAGDRDMVLVRPPAYDSPTTRGLLDTKTGVYWAVDLFATPVPGGEHAQELAGCVDQLDAEFWAGAMAMFALGGLSPWLTLVDPARFAAEVQRFADQPISTIISAHSPLISGPKVAQALSLMRGWPTAECPPAPDQAALDIILAATTAA